MEWGTAFNLLYFNHDFAASMVSLPNMLIPIKITSNNTKTELKFQMTNNIFLMLVSLLCTQSNWQNSL